MLTECVALKTNTSRFLPYSVATTVLGQFGQDNQKTKVVWLVKNTCKMDSVTEQDLKKFKEEKVLVKTILFGCQDKTEENNDQLGTVLKHYKAYTVDDADKDAGELAKQTCVKHEATTSRE